MVIELRNRFFRWSAVVVLLGALCGFPNASNATDQKRLIKVAGSTTLLPIVVRAAETFSSKNSRVIINGGGSGVGILGVGTDRIDIGLASRQLTPEEKKRFSHSNLKIRVIGRDAVACVLSSRPRDPTSRARSRTSAEPMPRWDSQMASNRRLRPSNARLRCCPDTRRSPAGN